MSDKKPAASRIETLRISLRPGASTITQLATALTKRDRTRAETISVSGFFMPRPILVRAVAGPQRLR